MKPLPVNALVVRPASKRVVIVLTMQLQQISDRDHSLTLKHKTHVVSSSNSISIKTSTFVSRPPTSIQNTLKLIQVDAISNVYD